MTKRILLIEDDNAIARVLCDKLVVEGFAVEWSADGRNAAALRRGSRRISSCWI